MKQKGGYFDQNAGRYYHHDLSDARHAKLRKEHEDRTNGEYPRKLRTFLYGRRGFCKYDERCTMRHTLNADDRPKQTWWQMARDAEVNAQPDEREEAMESRGREVDERDEEPSRHDDQYLLGVVWEQNQNPNPETDHPTKNITEVITAKPTRVGGTFARDSYVAGKSSSSGYGATVEKKEEEHEDRYDRYEDL